jgi:hypothetical protein
MQLAKGRMLEEAALQIGPQKENVVTFTAKQISTSAPAVPESISYEPRFIAYIDVLGWSALIERSISHPEERKSLNIAQSYLQFQVVAGEGKRKFLAEHLHESPRDMVLEATQFSDTLVISCPLGASCETSLLSTVQMICEQLLHAGHYTRGAIITGLLYHRENLIFGPALIEAYKLERDVAKYPRIILSPDAASRLNMSIRLPNGDLTYFRNIRKDNDGLDYLDVLGMAAGRLDEPRRKPPGLDELFTIVTSKLDADRHDLGRVAKHSWMLNYLREISNECLA